MKFFAYLKNQQLFSSLAFIALGFSASLGNIWRYPAVAYTNSGGEFFIAYVFLLIFIGFPFLLMFSARKEEEKIQGEKEKIPFEISFLTRFSHFWFLIALAVCIGYFSIVVSWSANLLVGESIIQGENTKTFFYDFVLRYSIEENIILHIFIACFALWIGVWFLLQRKVQFIIRLVILTLPFAFISLFYLSFFGIFLDNSGEGLREFFIIDWKNFSHVSLWTSALSQTLFSLFIGFGVLVGMTNSIPKRILDMRKIIKFVLFGNILTAFLVGIIMYSTIGDMTHVYKLPVEKVFVSNPGIAFVIFPEIILNIPITKKFLFFLFFGSFLFLSFFIITLWTKSIIMIIQKYCPKIHLKVLASIICTLCFSLSIPYMGSKGIFYLDIMDHLIIDHTLLWMAFLESILFFVLYKRKKFQSFFREDTEKIWRKKLFFIGIYILPLFFFIFATINTINEYMFPYKGYPYEGIIKYGIFPVLFTLLGAVILENIERHYCKRHNMNLSFFYKKLDLRKE